ncbi:MAG: HD domain-containing protein [Hespellia sp.]|nr:HD domain-containing protein [Hespellia sp.]
MKRVNAIWEHPFYQEQYQKLMMREKDRVFCRHQIEHLLNVARIAYIYNLEQGLGIDKELIYITAILHDIGKYEQYESGTPHEIAGSRIANHILRDLNGSQREIRFTEKEIRQILSAILNHRRQEDVRGPLDALLYASDKRSRNCFACPARTQCDWEEQRKNKEILI